MARPRLKVHASLERPESGWEAASRPPPGPGNFGPDSESARIPWFSAGAGALRSPCARREGRLARPAPPRPRSRRGAGRGLRACALGLRTAPASPEQAAPRDRCPYPRWRPRPGLTGSPSARASAPRQESGPSGPHRWPPRRSSLGRRTRLSGATARVDVTTRLDSQHFPNHQASTSWRL